MIFTESILDAPQDTLDQNVWNLQANPKKPSLQSEAKAKLDKAISWVQDKYHFEDLSVYIIGSICSNSYSDSSDIDLDFCAKNATKDDDDPEVVKEFGWRFKKDFIDNYIEANQEDSMIGGHPLEVYFNPNPFQCFTSIGCYNVLEDKWEVGPVMKSKNYDPIADLYSDSIKQAKNVIDDIRDMIFDLYQLSIVAKKSSSQKFKDARETEIIRKLEKSDEILSLMKKTRSKFQMPVKSREAALKRRDDRRFHVADAAFKFLDKFGYIDILKKFAEMSYDEEDGGVDLDQEELFDRVVKIVSDGISTQKLQDSELEGFPIALDESFADASKFMLIAGLMAMSELLPSTALARELVNAKRNTPAEQRFTVNSPAAKKAVSKAARGNVMIGKMSKTNVVNAIAKVLWREARGEGEDGLRAIASVIWNRAGGNPVNFIPVIKQKRQFSCLNSYTGGWTDSDYRWYNPNPQELANKSSKRTWELCKDIALEMVDKKFKSTIGNRNVYANDSLDDQSNLDSWGKDCDLPVGKHRFGYRKEYDPKIVKPGTFTSWKKMNKHAEEEDSYVVVKNGDTLEKIARANNTTVGKLLSLNTNIKNKNKINIGQKIRIS